MRKIDTNALKEILRNRNGKIITRQELAYFGGGIATALIVTWTLALFGVPPIGLNEFLATELPDDMKDGLLVSMLCEK